MQIDIVSSPLPPDADGVSAMASDTTPCTYIHETTEGTEDGLRSINETNLHRDFLSLARSLKTSGQRTLAKKPLHRHEYSRPGRGPLAALVAVDVTILTDRRTHQQAVEGSLLLGLADIVHRACFRMMTRAVAATASGRDAGR